MKLWVFRNEPGTGYYFCTKQPEPIYGDDMKSVVYTNYGELIGCIPTLTFNGLFPQLVLLSGNYCRIDVDDTSTYEGRPAYRMTKGER